jgi:hypothetical protein
LTGKYFVALSPHLTLITHPNRSGLRENFLSAKNINDQLAPFANFHDTLRDEFHGTVIRIPLRTAQQAKKSKIIDLVITPEELLKYFAFFQNEVEESFPFLKYIEKVEFRLDKDLLGVIELTNVEEIRQARSDLIAAIRNSAPISVSLELKMSYTYAYAETALNKRVAYVVQHRYADFPQDTTEEMDGLRALIRDENYYPWVALTAPLDTPAEFNCGRVFVTLPLSVTIKNTRVNLHGILALSRDRRSLWTPADYQKWRSRHGEGDFMECDPIPRDHSGGLERYVGCIGPHRRVEI